MFGIGGGEMLMVAVVVLIALGPKRLPDFMRTVGKGLREVRRAANELRKHSGIDELMREDPIGMRALERDLKRAPAPRREHKLTMEDREREVPTDGVDMAHARYLQTLNEEGVAVAPSVAVGEKPSGPEIKAAESSVPAPPMKPRDSVDNAEPTMMGVPAVDLYAKPVPRPSAPPPIPPEAHSLSVEARDSSIPRIPPPPRVPGTSVPPDPPRAASVPPPAPPSVKPSVSVPPRSGPSVPPPPPAPRVRASAPPTSGRRASLPASIPPPSPRAQEATVALETEDIDYGDEPVRDNDAGEVRD